MGCSSSVYDVAEPHQMAKHSVLHLLPVLIGFKKKKILEMVRSDDTG